MVLLDGTNTLIPLEPNCGEVTDRPPDECWKPCQCECWWKEQLEYRQTLSQEELDDMHEVINEV